jgi:aspartate dehydrogenase
MSHGPLQIALLGCGNIAGIVAARADGPLDIVACHDIDMSRTQSYSERTGARACASLDELLQADFDVLLEAASIDAVRSSLLPALEVGKDVVVLSVGGLYDAGFLSAARQTAARVGRHIHVPSGAIFGLDNLQVARLVGLQSLVLKSSKRPGALGLEGITERRCVFRGTASRAIEQFPRNINISSALGLATGSEPDVEIWADPEIEANRHEISAIGPFGEVHIVADNLPSPDNPATSYLAALSVLALLKRLGDPLQIGS